MLVRSLRAWLPASGSGSDVPSHPVGVEIEIELVSASVVGGPAILRRDAVAHRLNVTSPGAGRLTFFPVSSISGLNQV